MVITPDPLRRPEPPHDPNDPRFDHLERREKLGGAGPATWIFSGLLAVGVIIGIFVFGSDTTNEPTTQTTQNVPVPPPSPPPTQSD